ncbi:tektin-1 [Myripristis murdjan]|uniref:Tektin n=1 Tax=Myripristis murdjan TaxID=586833 RepID=A0A667ZNU8_9TELE|nr:tektin-1 [Myripristis murdjan]
MSLLDSGPLWATGPNLENIERMQTHSELLTAESKKLIWESDKAAQRLQQDANKRLDQRIRDIQFLRKELEQKLEEIIVEIDSLVTFKSRVEKALQACAEPLRVTNLCLEERMRRSPSERQHDEVDRELLREREAVEGVASLLQHTLEQITEQIRLNRSAQYHLEKDLKGKFEAQCIDDSCALITNHSLNTVQRSATTTLPSMVVSPEEWESFSDINMAKAEQEKTNSLFLRTLVDSVLEQTAADLRRQLQATTAAFQFNVQEIKNAKSQMEDQLTKILTESASQQKNMGSLQVAIADKQILLRVAESRLSTRSRRPVKERCHDPAQCQLLSEVQQLRRHISRMQEAAAQSQVEQRNLNRCQVELQENIGIKSSSLYIDEVVCAQLRVPIVIHNF